MKQIELVQKIKSNYEPKQTKEDKFLQLKKLNNKAKLPSRIFAYIFGTVGSLVMGTGMCLAMKVIGGEVAALMPVGIVIGLIGIVMMSITYPIYKTILTKGKQKYAQDIIVRSNEILNGEE
ncbi:MAG: dihydropteridine reductase [Clostridia bacterium]|nr:dihydropteridine reductase [Clostridia bacterium]